MHQNETLLIFTLQVPQFTLKKEGRAFRNIGNISLYCLISLAYFRLLFKLSLINQQQEDPVLLFCHGGPCKNYYVLQFTIL